MHECRQCGHGVEDRFRYCPWCSTPQRTKFVEFFAPHPEVGGDSGKGLRVSRYLGDEDRVPQVRLSVWSGDTVDAAISLSNEETARLSAFLAPPPTQRRPILDQLRDSLRI